MCGRDYPSKLRSSCLHLRSVSDWSRQEVELAIRQIAQSVERQTHTSGRQGYLNFIRKFV